MIKFLFGIYLIVYGFYRALFSDPVWGIYLFAAFTHIRLAQLSENIYLPLQVPIVIAGVTLFMYIVSPRYERKFTRWPLDVWLLGAMVLGMAASSASAFYAPDISWARTGDFFKYWVFFILLIQMVDSLEKVEWFHRMMILSAGWLVYRCWDLRGTTGFRFENTGGDVISDANHFATALVLLFPFVFKKALSQDRRVAIAAVVLCFGMLMSVVISVSRGGALGCVAVFCFILLNFNRQRLKMAMVTLLIGGAVLFFANADQKERLFGIADAVKVETRDASSQGRVNYWQLSWDLFKEHPVAGVGIGNFPYYSGIALEGLQPGEPGHVAHSIWFEVLAEGGLAVAVPFLLLIGRFFLRMRRLLGSIRQTGIGKEHEHYIRVLAIALGAFLVSATFLNRLIYEPIYWCIALGFIHEDLLNNLAAAPERSVKEQQCVASLAS
jgi:ABC-type transport system involved in cytochrome c biogenesis permease component